MLLQTPPAARDVNREAERKPEFSEHSRSLLVESESTNRSVMQATKRRTNRRSFQGVTSAEETAPAFALLTPYTGGNLGDGAIQDAVIESIRNRFPTATIYGITLDPADTARRHGIASFPLAGLSVSDYAVQAQPRPESTASSSHRPSCIVSVSRSVARFLASGPISAARLLLPRGWPSIIRCEVSHIWNGFRFIKDLDFLIISGGGQLDDFWGGPWGHPYALLKWTVLARLRGARPIFLSVGFGTLGTRLSRMFTRTALSLAAYRSYRDSGSRDLMKLAGFCRDDPVYPDLAYSLSLDSDRRSRDFARFDAGSVVGLSPFCYCDPRIWPRKDASIYDTYLRNLADFVQWLVAQKCRVSLFTSDSPDQFAIDDLWELLSARMSAEDLDCITRHQVTNVNSFIDHASRVDLMVASRLHSVILAQLAGTPVIALSYDRKVDVQMESVGHGSFRLPLEAIQLSEMQACFERLRANHEAAREQIRARFLESRAQLEAQYDGIFRPRRKITTSP